MGNYSKLFGSIIGGALGLAVARFGLPADLASPEVVGAVTTVGAAVLTWLFPANSGA